MKYNLFIPLLLTLCTTVVGQTVISAIPPVDKSPLDMSYYPKDYPVLKAQGKGKDGPTARIIYSRPQKNGRSVFGELVHYNEIWRIGANENTELEFYKDVTIGGKKVAKGRYSVFCIPNTTSWTVIINKDTDCWGAFKYDTKKDVLRTIVPITSITTAVESFSAYFEPSITNGFNLVFSWDNVRCALPIK